MKLMIDSIFCFSYHKGAAFFDVTQDSYELLFIQSGTGVFLEGTKRLDYTKHDVFFSSPKFKRSISAHTFTEYICIRFQSKDEVTDLIEGLYHADYDKITTLFTQICQEYQRKEFKYYECSIFMLQEIILYLARLLPRNTKNDLSIHKLIKKIDTTLDLQMTVQEMADSISYNYDYFRHAFKDITGQAPLAYLTNKRIQNACDLLENGNLTCTAIAYLCGFSSPSQFSKLFKRIIGISPIEYQKSLSEKALQEEKVQYMLRDNKAILYSSKR